MKKIALVLITVMCALFVGNVLAQVGDAVVVDSTGTDFQYYWYVGTPGQQICVDDQGTAHIVYCKTFCTASDTGHQVMYANATTGTTIPIPSQMLERPVQPGVVFIDGGHNGTPVYMMYGVGSRYYSYATWDEHHFQAMAKLSADGTSIDTLGVQEDGAYYGGPNFTNPFAMEVDNANGIAHCLTTTPNGYDYAYWNFDGTTFGECFNMSLEDPGSGVPGLSPNDWYSGYLNTQSQGSDLAISPDGSEVAVSGLHPRRQIDIILGSLGGEIWPDSMGAGVNDGSIILLYDTTGQREGTNIPNNDPKPYGDLQISYDSNGNLHVVFDAAYIDVYVDTVSLFPGYDARGDDWWRNHSSACVGDTNACFYDGSVHPKPQLLYWNNISNTITTLAECAYPIAGEEYKWWNNGSFNDGGAGNWGKNYDDQLISNFDLVANKNPQAGEPDMVIVWEEPDAPISVLTDADSSFCYNYFAFTTDLKLSYLENGVWSAPINLTNSPGIGEQSVSVYQDIIDNKIHMMYYRDDWPGRDRNLVYVDDYEDDFVLWTEHGLHGSQPIRHDQTQQVEIVYQEVDFTALGIEGKKYLPGEFNLAQNYPNPFNPTTTINFTVPTGDVTMEIYNVLGQKVKTLVDKSLPAGSYQEVWDGKNDAGKLVSSGIYLYRLKSEAGVKVKKMLFQK